MTQVIGKSARQRQKKLNVNMQIHQRKMELSLNKGLELAALRGSSKVKDTTSNKRVHETVIRMVWNKDGE